MEMGGQRHAPAALPPGKIRYPLWVGPRAGLDECGKSRLLRDSIPGAIPTEPLMFILLQQNLESLSLTRRYVGCLYSVMARRKVAGGRYHLVVQ